MHIVGSVVAEAAPLRFHECMPGIITLRLLSYCYGDPNELLDARVIQFLENFNANTGALDLIQSSWAGVPNQPSFTPSVSTQDYKVFRVPSNII